MTRPTTIKKDRYPGIRSFEAEDERLFYGRTKELDDLFSLVVIKPLVVLFGKSGLGKSSLLKAGLGPLLRKSQYFPLMIRVQNTNISLIKTVLSELQPYVDPKQLNQYGGKSKNDIWETLKACHIVGPNGEAVTPVLIFDQFEELFNHNKEAQKKWARQISDLIEGRLPKDLVNVLQKIPRKERTQEQLAWFKAPQVKILFAIRSDRMSELHQLRNEIPAILQNRYELKPLQSNQSGEAIMKPAALLGDEFTSQPFHYAPETVEEIQNNLSNEAGEIESFQLQIVCQHIERKVKVEQTGGHQNIMATPDFLGGHDGIQDILKNYYENNIKNLGSKEQQRAARKLLEEGLIAEGRRIGVADAVVKGNYEISDDLLVKLLESRLIRPENTRLGRTYEISHDTLVAPILEALEKRKLAEERLNRQKELAEREEQLVIEKKKRRKSYLLAAAASVLSMIALFALLDSRRQKLMAEASMERYYRANEAAQKSNALSQKIINSFSFYGDSLALASKKDNFGRIMYGYINKDGEVLIDYNYTQALPFDDITGYALVTRSGGKFLLWPNKSEYAIVDNIKALTSKITALDLGENYLQNIPVSIFQQHQLKVLLLNYNLLKNLSSKIGNLSDLQVLNLRKNKISSIPPQIGKLQQLEQLELSSNKLTTIPSEVTNLKKLKFLGLSANDLKHLPPEIGSLVKLEYLYLGDNELDSLPAEVNKLVSLRELELKSNPNLIFPSQIKHFTKLQILNLQNTGLGIYPEELNNLQQLIRLDLGFNSLKELSPEISNIRSLKELYLYANNLEFLPENIGQLNALRLLHLGENKLDSLPPNLGNLTKLEELYLYSNQLKSLPKEIGGLKSLRTLNLGNNALVSVPEQINNLINLEDLSLLSNILKSLPDNLDNLTFLKDFNIEDNKLKSIPASIGKLTNLEKLNLAKNELDYLPGEIGNLKKLQVLDLALNKNLNELPSEIGNMPGLKKLYLHGCALESLPKAIGQLMHLDYLGVGTNKITEFIPQIGQLRNLNWLSFYNNELKNLPVEIGQLVNLNYLSLGKNALKSIPPEIGKLKNLQDLKLSDNQLTILPEEMRELTNLRSLDLSNNPIPEGEINKIKNLLPNCKVKF